MQQNQSTPPPASSRNRRRTLRGMLVRPHEQVKYGFLFLGGLLLSLAAMIAVLITSVTRTMDFLESSKRLEADVSSVIRESLSSSLYVILFAAAGFAILALGLGLRLSHRIFGPMVPLNRMVSDLKAGNYSARVQLRQGDQFTELASSLNELAETLEKQHGKR